MVKLMFWGKTQKVKVAKERRISVSRIRERRLSISKYAREAQKCDIAIAKIDKELSTLSGKFIRATSELLKARRFEWEGRLVVALANLKIAKSSLISNNKHNLNLVTRRLG